MSMKEEIPFTIHVAKAKDLPFSWYELVLRPEKFAEHLQELRSNPEASPNAAHLIVTFLDKAGVYAVLSDPNSTSFKDAATGEKEMKLVECALMMGSFLYWNGSLLWNELPLSVQYCLVSLLRDHYPSPEVGVATSEGAAAHVIFSEWVLKFVTHECHAFCVPSRPPVHVWDTPTLPAEQIKDKVKLNVQEALSCLTEFLGSMGGVADEAACWVPPRVGVALPVLTGNKVYLEPCKDVEEQGLPLRNRLCELEYVIGCYHFVEEHYELAHAHLLRAQELLTKIKGHCEVEKSKLTGYLLACEGVLGRGRGRDDEGRDSDVLEEAGGSVKSPAGNLEKYMLSKDYKSVMEVLVLDLQKGTLPPQLLGCVEREVPTSVQEKPQPKRQKLDSSSFSSLGFDDQVSICGSVARVLMGVAPHPRLWKILRTGGKEHLEFILQLCEDLLKKELPFEKKQFLQIFIKSVCSANVKSWQQLLLSPVAQPLTLPQDSVTWFGEDVTGYDAELGDHTFSSAEHFERMLSQVSSPQEMMKLVEGLFKATPTAQHRAVAAKWVGSSRGFAPLESVTDHVAVTKYNNLIHRVQMLGRSQCYSKSLELYTAAQQLLNSASFRSSKFKSQLKDYVEEELLVAELVMSQGTKTTALLAKARTYCTNRHHWSSVNAPNLHVVCAYLINIEDLSFLFQSETPRTSTSYTVGPRLAEAVVDVMEGKDLRKCSRGLFEAVLSVFTPLLHSNEGKTEGNDRQTKLRANLDLFIRNLRNPIALSLMTAALARIWNLLKKPEDEILTDFNGHWPTAIGNAANIDAGHVFRMLNRTLNHALQLYPQTTSWVIIKANVHTAVGEHGAALESYMEAGAIASAHYHQEVQEKAWSQVTLRRLISCCCRLGYITQGVVLCQLLRPVSYELAFSILRENASHTVDTMFPFFWDMTIIEYLIYIHSKKVDSHKQAAAIQVASQVDLNFNNSMEVLQRAAEVRRRRFLRTFYTQITHCV